MIKLLCDYCQAETDNLIKTYIEGFADKELCAQCNVRFIETVDIAEQKAEKARLTYLSKALDILPVTLIVEVPEHEHTWSQGWTLVIRNKLETTQLCTFHGCKEQKVTTA